METLARAMHAAHLQNHAGADEVAVVKHDLTIGIASECAIEASSDPRLRESSLNYNALARAVTCVTQRSGFCCGASKIIHRLI